MPRSRFLGRAQAWLLGALALALAGLLVAVATRAARRTEDVSAPVPPLGSRPEPAPATVAPAAAELEAPEARGTVEAPPAVDEREPTVDAVPAPAPEAVTSELAVEVRGPNGAPWAAPLELRIEPLAAGIEGRRPAPAWHESIGPRATLTGLPAGRVRGYARARAARSAPFEVELPPGGRAALVVTLFGAGAVEGRLVDAAGAAPGGVALALRAPGGSLEDVRTGPDGAFRFDPVLDGEHELVFGNPNAPLRPPLAVRHVGVLTDLGTVALPELASVAVFVVDAAGRPVEGARVWDAALVGYFDLVTDAAGSCRARLLPPGGSRVFADHPAHGRANRPVKLEAGREARVDIALPR